MLIKYINLASVYVLKCAASVQSLKRGWFSYYRFIKFNGSKALQMGALNVCQVLEMTRSVLSDTHNTWNETVISVSWVLSNLVEGRNFASQLDMTSLQLFVTVLETCIAMLSAVVKNHKVRDQNAENTKREAVLLMSCITLSVAR